MGLLGKSVCAAASIACAQSIAEKNKRIHEFKKRVAGIDVSLSF
jgi:hypothetical protein